VNVSMSLIIASPAKRSASRDLWAAASSPAPQASAIITGTKHKSAAFYCDPNNGDRQDSTIAQRDRQRRPFEGRHGDLVEDSFLWRRSKFGNNLKAGRIAQEPGAKRFGDAGKPCHRHRSRECPSAFKSSPNSLRGPRMPSSTRSPCRPSKERRLRSPCAIVESRRSPLSGSQQKLGSSRPPATVPLNRDRVLR